MQKRQTLLSILRKQSPSRRRPGDEEHRIQCACVRWFRLKYPYLSHALFSVPNGGARDPVTGARLKAEGVLPGVADIILLVHTCRYGALLIEMKTGSGRQSAAQKQWQKAITADDCYRYTVCRSLEDFIRETEDYLKT